MHGQNIHMHTFLSAPPSVIFLVFVDAFHITLNTDHCPEVDRFHPKPTYTIFRNHKKAKTILFIQYKVNEQSDQTIFLSPPFVSSYQGFSVFFGALLLVAGGYPFDLLVWSFAAFSVAKFIHGLITDRRWLPHPVSKLLK